MHQWGGIEPYVDLDKVIEDSIIYTVQEGEGIWKISEDNYLLGEPYKYMAAATYRYGKNNGEAIDIVRKDIQPGDQIVIPQIYKYDFRIRLVQPGENLWDIARAEYGWGEVYIQILEWNNWWANTYYTAFYDNNAGNYRMQNIDQCELEAYAPLCLRDTDYFDWKVKDGETASSLAERIYGNAALAYIIEEANASQGKSIEDGKYIVIPMKGKAWYNRLYSPGDADFGNTFSAPGTDTYNDTGFTSNGNYKIDTTPVWGVGIYDDETGGINDENMMKLLNSNNIFTRTQLNDRYTKYSRFGYLDPYNALTQTREYLFFTKPDLHLFQDRNPTALNPELARYPFFRDALLRYPYVMQHLQQRVGDDNPLMPLLTNTVSSSLDLPDASAEEMDTMANIYGTKLTYRGSSYKSDEQHQFSLEFTDTKYLEIYMLFKIYDDYEKLKKMGRISLPDVNYIYRKILHDQFSIFKFIVDEDGETLLYWAKTYGTYPLSVPRNAISDLSDNSRLKFTIDFKCQFVDDMDPQILVDFNTLVQSQYSGLTEMPLFDQARLHPDGEWAKIPYIAYKTAQESPGLKGMQKKYMLKWRK